MLLLFRSELKEEYGDLPTIGAAALEAAAADSAAAAAAAAGSKNLLSVDRRFLNAEAEMKRKFGASAMSAASQQARPSHGRRTTKRVCLFLFLDFGLGSSLPPPLLPSNTCRHIWQRPRPHGR